MPWGTGTGEPGNDAGLPVARVRPNPDVVSQRLGDEFVLVHLHSNQIYRLNSTGARIWELLSSGLDRDQIRNALVQEYDVGDAEVTEEVDALLTWCLAEGLVQHHGGD